MANAVPAIVTADLWQAAQAKRGTRRFGTGRPWHRPYLLSGLIVCGAYHASGPTLCDGLSVPVSRLDEAVLDGIRKRLDRILDPATLQRRLR